MATLEGCSMRDFVGVVQIESWVLQYAGLKDFERVLDEELRALRADLLNEARTRLAEA